MKVVRKLETGAGFCRLAGIYFVGNGNRLLFSLELPENRYLVGRLCPFIGNFEICDNRTIIDACCCGNLQGDLPREKKRSVSSNQEKKKNNCADTDNSFQLK